MVVIEQHWKRISLQVGLLATCAAVLLGVINYKGDVSAVAQDLEVGQIDPWIYDQARDLRQDLALTNRDLAAMGMQSDQATAVLLDLREWVERSRTQIEAKELAVIQARRELRQAQRSIRMGPRDEAVIRSVPGLQERLAEALAAETAMKDAVAETIAQRLTQDQQALWQGHRDNADLPERYRYIPGLNTDQKQAIRTAFSSRNNDKIRSRYTAADGQLSSSQKQSLTAIESTRSLHIDEVEQAEAQVLPRPVAQELIEAPEEGG